MTTPGTTPTQKSVAGIALTYVSLLFVAWIGAWLLSMYSEEHAILPATQLVRFAYWTALRILVWLIPSIAIIRRSGRRFRDALALGRFKSALLWGGIAGLLVGISTLIFRAAKGLPLFSVDWNWSLLTAIIVGPIVEEITFRGAVMGALQTRCPFSVSNLITGVLFLLIHLPGWYFQGGLAQRFINPTGGALSILLLGWLFGYVAQKSRSLAGSILTHILNNIFTA